MHYDHTRLLMSILHSHIWHVLIPIASSLQSLQFSISFTIVNTHPILKLPSLIDGMRSQASCAMTRECSNKLILSSQKLLELPHACRKERTEIFESISTFCFTRLNHNIGDVLDQVYISNLVKYTFNTICPQNLRHNYFHFTHITSIWNAHWLISDIHENIKTKVNKFIQYVALGWPIWKHN